MIFLVEKGIVVINVTVYENLEDLSQRIEWQDILEPSLRILDDNGTLYVWDNSKSDERGMVYDYTFKTAGTDEELAQRCKVKYRTLGKVDNFDT